MLRCPFCFRRQSDLIVLPGDPSRALISTVCRDKRCKEPIIFPLEGFVL